MSIEKTAASGSNPATVRFYYDTDKIFNSLSIRTTYKAKNIAEGVKEDEISISEMELEIVKEHLEQSVFEIFGEIFNLTDGVDNQIFFDTSFTPSGGIAIKASGGLIKDNSVFDQNTLLNIDKKIENCIRYYILSEWYVICGLADDVKLNYEKYIQTLGQLKSLVLKLRKPILN